MVKILDEFENSLGAPKAEASPTIVKNNNPGALEDGDFARSQPGYVKGGGRFAKFATPEDGIRAQETLLRNSPKYKGKSFVEILNSYTPPTPENSGASRANYIGYVSKRLGLDPNAPVPETHVGVMAQAMREFETGKTKKIQFTPYAPALRGSPGGKSVADARSDPYAVLASLESALGPDQKVSSGVKVNADRVFGSDKAMESGQKKVEQKVAQTGAAIDVLDQVTQSFQAVQLASATEQVAATKAISDETTQAINTLKDQVKPVFEQRGRIAGQLEKIAGMNPLERGLRGIFDLNYDEKFLQQQLETTQAALDARAHDFDYLNKLQNAALGEVARRYGLETALPELAVEQATSDMTIVGMSLKNSIDALDATKSGITNQVQLIQSKQAVRGEVMSRLDMPTLLDLANQAAKSGGVVVRDGIELDYTSLRAEFKVRENQDLQGRAYRLAIANNEVETAAKFADAITDTLTRPQLEAAMANGGVHNGIKLNESTLTAAYKNAVTRDVTQAEVTANAIPDHVALKSAGDAIQGMTGLFQRTQKALGTPNFAGAASTLSQAAAITKQIADLRTSGQGTPEMYQALLGKLGQLQDGLNKQVGASILQSVGGDKRAAGYVQSFVSGVPIDAAVANEAIAYFAEKGSLPKGFSSSPEARQLFEKASSARAKILKDNPKASAQQVQAAVTQELELTAASTIGGARFQRVWEALPTVAAATGQTFAKIGTQAWKNVTLTAANDAATAIARKSGLSKEQVLQFVTQGAPTTGKPADLEAYRVFQANEGAYNTLEQTAIMQGLDELPQVQPGRRNSSLYLDTLQNPRTLEHADAYTKQHGSNAFGDYLANPLGGQGLMSAINQTGKLAKTAQDDLTQTTRLEGRRRANMFKQDPVMRTQVILASIEGVGRDGAAKLAPFIQQTIKSNQSVFGSGPLKNGITAPGFENSQMVSQDSAIHDALMRTKFDDPATEAYRKQAIKMFKTQSTQTRNFVDQILHFGSRVMSGDDLGAETQLGVYGEPTTSGSSLQTTMMGPIGALVTPDK